MFIEIFSKNEEVNEAHSLTSYSRVAFYDRPRIMEAIKKTKSQRTRMNLANKVASGIL